MLPVRRVLFEWQSLQSARLRVARVEVAIPQDATRVRDRLHQQQIPTYEADVRFAVRYLIDRNIRGGCLIDGAAERLLAIALHGRQPHTGEVLLEEVLVVDPSARNMPPLARGFPDERRTIEAFCARVAQFDPDVLTGWNVIDFDLSVLQRIAARERAAFALGRGPGQMRLRAAEGYFGSGSADIPGAVYGGQKG